MREETVLEKANRLRKQIAEAEKSVSLHRVALESLESNCRHEWSEATKTNVDGFREVADPTRNVMHGSDFFPGSRWERYYKPAWTRSCLKCGKVETTTETVKATTTVVKPKF